MNKQEELNDVVVGLVNAAIDAERQRCADFCQVIYEAAMAQLELSEHPHRKYWEGKANAAYGIKFRIEKTGEQMVVDPRLLKMAGLQEDQETP